MTAALITGPALEPVSLADVKAHLRVDASDEDALLTAAIVSARVHVESATRRVLIEQGWRIYYDAWPRRRIVRLPVAPLMSVDAVTIYDAAGDPQVVDAEDYEADVAASPARLVLAANAPTPVGRAVNGIEIDVTAGYGATSVDVPAALRQAVLMLVAHWYEHRGAVGHDLAVLVAPLGFEALIAPYRLLSL
ncbi:head-tail connector protein [Bauldia litoralis]|uniref:head-tail connector protein n=2 Tax=Alphaproteobacteria TaxID=28211 RepID=UPI0032631165